MQLGLLKGALFRILHEKSQSAIKMPGIILPDLNLALPFGGLGDGEM